MLIGIGVVLVLLGGTWFFRSQGNERHLDDLLEMGYEFSGFDDEQPKKLAYTRRTSVGDDCGQGDDWYGAKAAGKSDPDNDYVAAAEPTARRFQAEGWETNRWIAGNDTSSSQFLQLEVTKSDDMILISYFRDGGISLTARSGPCLPDLDLIKANDWTLVNEFPTAVT